MSETAVNVIDEWLAADVPGGNTSYNLIFCLDVAGFVIIPKKSTIEHVAREVISEFEDDLTGQERDYIVDQVVRRSKASI